MSAPLNGIRATMFHDEGAVAHCGNCGRYTLDLKALSDRQPVCTCGKQHYWSGSFVKPGSDAQWHGPAPAAPSDDLAARLIAACRRDALTWADRKAIGEAIGRIGAAFVTPDGTADAGFLQADDYHLLHRFIETTDDDQSYDIGKDAVKRLAELGVVQSHGFGRYSVTMFGCWVHERYWHQNPSLPLMTNSDRAKRAQGVAR